ncbi:MAG: hypothetical protein HUJ93_07725 [Bacteroidales bacterium]|nr:hypothetical protein [Bacteroidales bacterium]
MRKNYWLLFILLSISAFSEAQIDEYERFKQQVQGNYEGFKQQAEHSYSDFMRQAWERYEQFKMDPVPQEAPKPIVAPVATPQPIPQRPDNEPLGSLKPKDSPLIHNVPSADPQPVVKPLPDEPASLLELHVECFGVPCTLSAEPKIFTRPKGYTTHQIADYWDSMEATPNDAFWFSVTKTVTDFGLNDWGLYRLLESAALRQGFSQSDANLFCFYMLRSHGYDVKIALEDDNPALLMCFDCTIYRLTYIEKEGRKYHVVTQRGASGLFMPNDWGDKTALKPMSLKLTTPLNIGDKYLTRQLVFANDGMKVEVPYNPAHQRFYNDMPMSDIASHLFASMPVKTENALRKAFEERVKKMSKVELVSDMLHFVQKSFDYQTDEQQFGEEKYFYPEELFAYPYCDCEDRSALFIWLVLHFTDYDAVGLYYPGHEAAAVSFGDDITQGDKVTFKGKNYLICDPTYMGASIGQCMPQFKKVTPEVMPRP